MTNPYQQLPSQFQDRVEGSPHTASEVADGGADAVEAASAALDPSAPVISAATAGSITATGATITWTTDDAADSQVEYGLTESYGSSTTRDPAMVTSHSQAVSGLTAQTLYHYRVKSRNAGAALATSADATFTTLAP